MLTAVQMAVFGAAGLAMASAGLGVLIARACWADDLKQARRIDEIRSRTEAALKETIAAQEHTIDILHERLGERP